MTVAPGFRAVVFALRDLSASDKQHVIDVAQTLGWPPVREPLLWDTPLLLVRQSDTPPVAGLRTDAEVAASGPSVLLLAMRLLLADALHWPELRFLGIDRERDAIDYVLYAADPARWRPESLADALVAGASAAGGTTPNWHIHRGLAPRPERLPAVPGDRVPVLGLQVPLFGGRLKDLRDLRRPDEALGAPWLSALPSTAVPGHHQGRYALYLQIEQEETAGTLPPRSLAEGESPPDEAVVHLTLWRVDTTAATLATAALRLLVRDLCPLHDAEAGPLTKAALSDWLGELLPSCFLVAPTGNVLLIDWFCLDLAVRPDEAAAPPAFDLRACGSPTDDTDPDRADGVAGADAVDLTLLDPATWSLPVFADLLVSADLTVSASGRYVLIESTVPVDGELVNLAALLDTTASCGSRTLVCDLVDDATAPALVPDDVFPVLRGDHAAPGLIA